MSNFEEINNAVLVFGDSGSGKSYSLKNLDPATTFLIQCRRKPLSFKGAKNKYVAWGEKSNPEGNYIYTNKQAVIVSMINHINKNMPHIKTVVIDDVTHIMSDEFMNRVKETGWEKFNDIGFDVWKVLDTSTKLRGDLTAFSIMHPELSKDGRKLKIKTIGDMVDTKVDIPSLFTTVLYASVRSTDTTNEHFFLTQSNGSIPCKSPEGLFKTREIPNDLEYIRKAFEEFDGGDDA